MSDFELADELAEGGQFAGLSASSKSTRKLSGSAWSQLTENSKLASLRGIFRKLRKLTPRIQFAGVSTLCKSGNPQARSRTADFGRKDS